MGCVGDLNGFGFLFKKKEGLLTGVAERNKVINLIGLLVHGVFLRAL